jgi:hypothetical protein
MMATRVVRKEKVEVTTLPKSNSAPIASIGLTESDYVLGCSSGAATNIAAVYDQPKKPNIHDD